MSKHYFEQQPNNVIQEDGQIFICLIIQQETCSLHAQEREYSMCSISRVVRDGERDRKGEPKKGRHREVRREMEEKLEDGGRLEKN